jgi:hypothetical protein
MNRNYYIIILLLVLSSCNLFNDTKIKNSKVDDPTKPYVHTYFSILAPGKNWDVKEKIDNNLYEIYFQTSESGTHSKIGYITCAKIDYDFNSPAECKKYISNQWFNQYNNSRFEVLENGISQNTDQLGGYSFNHIIKYKDLAAPNKKNNVYLLSEGYELFMLHPDNKRIFLLISYSERGTDGELKLVREKAEKFFSDFRIKVK